MLLVGGEIESQTDVPAKCCPWGKFSSGVDIELQPLLRLPSGINADGLRFYHIINHPIDVKALIHLKNPASDASATIKCGIFYSTDPGLILCRWVIIHDRNRFIPGGGMLCSIPSRELTATGSKCGVGGPCGRIWGQS